jgi:fluoroacetyl-CoA thioesterase
LERRGSDAAEQTLAIGGLGSESGRFRARIPCTSASGSNESRHEFYDSYPQALRLIRAIQLKGKAMQSIPVGATGAFSLVVTPDHLASRFKDVTLPPVLATPVMIMVMENAALNAIKPYLDAGESALGTRVEVRHLAATPAGRRVTGEAKVTNVDGRRIEFSIRAIDGNEEIGSGTHERVVIQLSRLSERMKAKFG